MATENEIALDLVIKSADSAKTVKELKASIKDLKNELNGVAAGSEQFKKLSKSINDTEGKLGDLNDSFNTLTGSGVERLSSSTNLLKEGFANFDLEKIKIGFKGLGAAMQAVPAFLLAQAIQYLIENFETVVEVVKTFIGVSREGEIQARRLTESIESQGKALTDLAEISDRYTKQELLNAKLRGASEQEQADITESGFKRKLRAAKDYVEETAKAYNTLLRNEDSTTEQVNKAGEALLAAQQNVKKLESELSNFKVQTKIDTNEKLKTEDKKYTEDYKKELAKRSAEFARQLELTVQSKIENEARDKQAIEDNKKAELDAILEINEADNKAGVDNYARQQQKVDVIKWTTETEKAAANESFAVAKMSIDNQMKLVNLFYDLKRSKLEKGSAEDLKAAKRQFQINKALAIQSAIISGIQGVVNALSAQSVIPEPFGTILKVATAVGVGVAAAVNIAKIASTKFDESGGGGSVSADVGSVGSTASAPAIPQPNNTVTQIKDDGSIDNKDTNKRLVIENKIVETDITQSQERVANIEATAKIG